MNLESLERVLTAYKATLYDLADQMERQRGAAQKEVPGDQDLLRSLTEAIRRVEGRLDQLEGPRDDGPV
jgi:hypothetical protein